MDQIVAFKEYLRDSFKGDVEGSDEAFRSKIVLFPRDANDIKAVVHFVRINKEACPDLSVAVGSAGAYASGEPLDESIILDLDRHMRGIFDLSKEEATVLPGTLCRDFELEAAKLGAMFPCRTALNCPDTIGGTVLNCGKAGKYIKELKAVFSDGNEYVIKPLDKEGLRNKLSQPDFEGEVYRKVWDIVLQNEAFLAGAKFKALKDSAGYCLWDVWDSKAEMFDMTRLILDSQGTLGIVTEIKIWLVPIESLLKPMIFTPNLGRPGDSPHLQKLSPVVADFFKKTKEAFDPFCVLRLARA